MTFIAHEITPLTLPKNKNPLSKSGILCKITQSRYLPLCCVQPRAYLTLPVLEAVAPIDVTPQNG
jgi:hypothetical protein